MSVTEKVKVGDLEAIVIHEDSYEQQLSDSDREMDARAKEAVRVAIEKAKFLKQPIARYDAVMKRAYIEYADGVKKYVG